MLVMAAFHSLIERDVFYRNATENASLIRLAKNGYTSKQGSREIKI
jgi:hypothetical protein